MRTWVRLALGAVLGLHFITNAAARSIAPGEDLQAAVQGLRAGDELVLQGGEYVLSRRLRIVARGREAAPIVIKAAPGERPVINQTNEDANIVEIARSRHLIVRGIELKGGSHGFHLEDSDFVTIEDCEIHHTGDVAIAANSGGTYDGLRILRNEIHHTDGSGEGMYLGCNEDKCRVANSLIAGNYVHHTNGATVEEGDGIELKEGSYNTSIRDNVVHDTRYPGIITYGTVGNGAPNIIEGNAIWNAGQDDNSLQVAADAIVRNNIVLGSPIALQANQHASPSHISIVHNTIIASGDGIVVRDVSGPIVIANNAVYAEHGAPIQLVGAAHHVTIAGNVGIGNSETSAPGFLRGNGLDKDFVDAHARGAPPIDLFPKTSSALINAGAPQYRVDRDFNGALRDRADAGAYNFQAVGNRGWMLRSAAKNARLLAH